MCFVIAIITKNINFVHYKNEQAITRFQSSIIHNTGNYNNSIIIMGVSARVSTDKNFNNYDKCVTLLLLE